jgi:predicted ATPase/class 3 adenylate cyclase
MPHRPSGTVTFLFTDIEASTDLLQRAGDARYAGMLADHRRLLRAAFRQEGGEEIGTQGDALLTVFSSARDAVAAAVAAQQALLRHSWPEGMTPRVRMGLHTGEPGTVAGEYIGLDVHRAARLCAAGHGGQILLSLATSALVKDTLPQGTDLRNLGRHRLRDLQQPENIFQVVHADLPAEFPPLRALDVLPNNLPRQLTSFIGREREILEVKRLLSTTSLLTLTGPGGCGKTRLALQVAADLIDAYADGVWLVELAGLMEPALVLHTLASTLGVREGPGRELLSVLRQYLESREVLLVLDNCEHVVAACAETAEALIRSCPGLRILVTSREPLGVGGETVWRVPSLSVPETGGPAPVEGLVRYEAVRLFIERAMAVQPAFTLTPQNTAAVAAVCRQLDGLPLAIELAAARMRALSAGQIAERLDKRFSLLTGGSRTVLPRQQTLRGALDWSHDLLSQNERALLRRLSVFAGGCTLEAAEAVCSDGSLATEEILDLLTQLVSKSLVLADAQDAVVRYRLLETVREYARDRLVESGDATNVQDRHLAWYLHLVEQAEPELTGPEQRTWLDRLETEHDNLRAMLEWSKVDDGSADAGLRAATALWHFWNVHGHFSEGRAWLETMLSRNLEAPAAVRAKALTGAGLLAHRQGDYDGAIKLCTEGLSRFRDLGDLSGMAQALYMVGIATLAQGDYETAKRLFQESLQLSGQTGNKRRMAIALNSIGEVARCQGDYAAARTAYEDSLALKREVGDRSGITVSVGNLGHVALHQGDCRAAAVLFKEALTGARELAHKVGIAEYLAGLGGVAAAEGRCARGARLLAAADSLLSLLGALLEPSDRLEYERSVAAARTGLSDEVFRTAWDEGRVMGLDQAIRYALQDAD